MNREEIENRIMICEQRERDYLEVGKEKIATKYKEEKRKWEKIISDLDLLNERKILELLGYKRGYFEQQEKVEKLKRIIKKLNHQIEINPKLMNIPAILDFKNNQVKENI